MCSSDLWHQRVRSATAMAKKAVIAALHAGTLDSSELYGLDDAGFYTLMSRPDRDPDGLIQSVFNGKLMACCYEAPYDEDSSQRRKAAHLVTRPAFERELAEALSRKAGKPVRVVMDLPEPLSFETGMTVVGTGKPFGDSATVFRPAVVKGFSGSLRVMRVFCSLEPEAAGPLVSEALGASK